MKSPRPFNRPGRASAVGPGPAKTRNAIRHITLSACCPLIILLTVILATPFSAHGATRYVSQTTGSDTIGDGTSGNPWATIQHALNYASSGDTVRVAAGDYSTATGESPSEGSSSNRIRGSLISMRPIATICCSPPLRNDDRRRRYSRSTGNSW